MKNCLLRTIALVCSTLLASAAWASLDDGFVLHYTFDADAGAIAVDQSPLGNNGVVNGATWFADGRIGGSMRFDGVNDMIQVTSNPTTSSNYTVALWFTSATPDNFTYKNLFSYNRRYQIQGHSESGKVGFLSYCLNEPHFGSGAVRADSDWMDMPEDTWHHVALVVAAVPPTATFYVDGLARGSTQGPAVNTGFLDVLIGALNNDPSAGPRYFWEGLIDEVMVYNRALSGTEILDLYRQAGPQTDAWIARIGFSNDPMGDQDVTEFLNDETFYVRVEDVALDAADPNVTVWVELKGKAANGGGMAKFIKVRQALEPQADGGFSGEVALNQFLPGTVGVGVHAVSGPGKSANWLVRRATIVISPPP